MQKHTTDVMAKKICLDVVNLKINAQNVYVFKCGSLDSWQGKVLLHHDLSKILI
jgi:hypothetical protein